MKNNTTRFFLIKLFLLLSSVFAKAQTFQGSGVIINNSGYIITNAHVIGDFFKSIIVEDYNGNQYNGSLIKIDYQKDLAIIKIEKETKYFAYLRMDTSFSYAELPIVSEEVNIIGYPHGNFEPRGGLVKRLSSPKFHNNGFTIGLSTTHGCSGAAVLDKQGLLIGILWGGIGNDGTYYYNGGNCISVFGINGNAILPFILSANIQYGVSTQGDPPFNLAQYNNIDRIEKIILWGSKFGVKIYTVH